ncbi:cobalamin biosynthesis protein CbiX [Xylophilus sp. Kf1]|nr:cobalamin biosynthesis protein CbiX [Xylophilus sp. Kf1]
MKAVVLFGHGSRDPAWRQPIEAVALRMQTASPDMPVRCAYLELTTPFLPDTTAELAATGIREIRIVPMFLGVGRHAREDLPRIVEALRIDHPDIAFELAPAVGEDDRLLDLLADIARG